MRYDRVFLDVDGTLLWVALDVEGYVEDLSSYAADNDGLTIERAAGPVWGSLRRHIQENIDHRTAEELARFKRRNAERTAGELGIAAPSDVLTEVAERRTSGEPSRPAWIRCSSPAKTWTRARPPTFSRISAGCPG